MPEENSPEMMSSRMFLEQRRHDLFSAVRTARSLQFRRVRQTVHHHQGDAALLQRFGDGFPQPNWIRVFPA